MIHLASNPAIHGVTATGESHHKVMSAPLPLANPGLSSTNLADCELYESFLTDKPASQGGSLAIITFWATTSQQMLGKPSYMGMKSMKIVNDKRQITVLVVFRIHVTKKPVAGEVSQLIGGKKKDEIKFGTTNLSSFNNQKIIGLKTCLFGKSLDDFKLL
ncbi:uncharacterized protein MELLADRAFT_101767 [Melampsora larici-populina 98AG31]|uniref:Uncharacterized protein n=1 Tax=Melampsora larici-populina (strain 98AG31 / pathotype 3-4-7) TaxID=747676 RepID=F4R6W5_MELLP|nr:uncharacterized protein MELLADRAFT_101767 [Melampsora larici-populina 98AG31]EGG11942.1 hypothetical protein MELLADRAFT_101767 [Melampsora larici-populina 98AG31]